MTTTPSAKRRFVAPPDVRIPRVKASIERAVAAMRHAGKLMEIFNARLADLKAQVAANNEREYIARRLVELHAAGLAPAEIADAMRNERGDIITAKAVRFRIYRMKKKAG